MIQCDRHRRFTILFPVPINLRVYLFGYGKSAIFLGDGPDHCVSLVQRGRVQQVGYGLHSLLVVLHIGSLQYCAYPVSVRPFGIIGDARRNDHW